MIVLFLVGPDLQDQLPQPLGVPECVHSNRINSELVDLQPPARPANGSRGPHRRQVKGRRRAQPRRKRGRGTCDAQGFPAGSRKSRCGQNNLTAMARACSSHLVRKTVCRRRNFRAQPLATARGDPTGSGRHRRAPETGRETGFHQIQECCYSSRSLRRRRKAAC